MTDDRKTIEPQYQDQITALESRGPVALGPTTSHLYRTDPRHLGFLLARYKFCAKMLSGRSAVLEAGCGDGLGLGVVLQEVDHITAVDIDPIFIDGVAQHAVAENLNVTSEVRDLVASSPSGPFDAAYSLDVIEHIAADKEDAFIRNIVKSLQPQGVLILGTPNVTAEKHASKWSKEGHINLKSAESLRELVSPYFYNVFMFSMNDEVVHTGFSDMAHYLFCMAVSVVPTE